MLRRAGLALLLLLLLPSAAAEVSVEEVRVPERTAAGKPFDVAVRLANDGPERRVHLFGALYTYEEGAAPCGPATDPRFRTFTHLVEVVVRLPAASVVEHPAPGERWLHRYDVEDAGEPRLESFCVFVADADGDAGPLIQYEAYGTTRLSVRARNAPPSPSFTHEPARPSATEEVRFLAAATDADGDPVTFAWDFGRHDAGGRARAEGERPSYAFYPEGEYVVTLTASDGIDEVPLARTLSVGPAGAREEEKEEGASRLPVPAALAVAAAGLAAAMRARRR